MTAFVHPTAIVEDDVCIGAGTHVWDHVHIRRGARIGEECIIGEKAHIAYDVCIGNRVKIGAFVHVAPGVTVEDGAMVTMGTIFTNELFPRATTVDLKRLLPSEPTERTLSTLVRQGVTIGANSTVRGGVVIGRFAMAGMASLVTKSVPDFHLVVGHPARSVGCVCRCGQLLVRFAADRAAPSNVRCSACGLPYAIDGRTVRELAPPT
jgi:acetyltransferase-like isoleucine patch superfamily enzyme